MEQKQYINNCILRLRKKKKIGSMKINKKTEEPENWVDDDPQATEQQNAKVREILEDLQPEKGNTFSKIL